MARPSGTVTFLFTDIEGSTRLWDQDSEAMRAALELHDAALSDAITNQGGYVFSTGGDGFAVAFDRVSAAVAAAVEGQRALLGQPWPEGISLKVRMALHTGEAAERDGDYFGPTLNRAARLMSAGHGGQVLCSAAVVATVGDLPGGSTLRDLGEHRLRDLSTPEHVFELLYPGGPAQGLPPLRSMESAPGNLPLQATGFIGREAQLVQSSKALAESRIVTLCGVGGVGKTRLALQVAADIVGEFTNGAWFVELAAVKNPDDVIETIAAALSIQPRPGIPVFNGVTDFLKEKSLLLVLDNCEHLLAAASRFAEDAVERAPGLRILATSRESLGVRGERVLTVPPLQLPTPTELPEQALNSESVRLFVERASDSNSLFDAHSVEDLRATVELCRRLDGIPLAIELAAARVGAMTPAEVTRHLDQRFKLLTRGRRTASTRQQTLRNTIDWSYDLLEDRERRVFRQCSVFSGDFSLSAGQAVIASAEVDDFEVLESLTRLVDQSLMVAERVDHETRYQLLETIREYAHEQMEEGEAQETNRRHAVYFVAWAQEAGQGLEGSDETLWRERVDQDLENLRAALRWLIRSGDTDAALTEVYALSNMFALSSMPFGLLALDVANMPGAAGHPLCAAALGSAAMTLTQQGAAKEAFECVQAAESAMAALGDASDEKKLRCRVRGCLTTPTAYHDPTRLIILARDGLEDAIALGDRYEEMRALILLSSVLDDDAQDEAITSGERGLALATDLQIASYRSWAPMMLATRLAKTDPNRALALLDEAKAVAISTDNRWAMIVMGNSVAAVYAAQGQFVEAAYAILSNAREAQNIGDEGATCSAVAILAGTFARLGDTDTALLMGAWATSRGHDPLHGAQANPTYAVLGVSAYQHLLSSQEAAADEALQRSTTLTTLDILSIAAARLEEQAKPHDGQTRHA